MTTADFSKRLMFLLDNANINNRQFSYQLDKNPSYTYFIINNKSTPSMDVFFKMCEILNITPKEFFDFDSNYPSELNDIIIELKKLKKEDLQNITNIIKSITKQ